MVAQLVVLLAALTVVSLVILTVDETVGLMVQKWVDELDESCSA